MQITFSTTYSARQARRQQLIRWRSAYRRYDASCAAWQASPDVDSDRRRIDALLALAAARAAVLEGARA
jgi:hypothetical protein